MAVALVRVFPSAAMPQPNGTKRQEDLRQENIFGEEG